MRWSAFEWDPYVRVSACDVPEWVALSWQARAAYLLLLRETTTQGTIYLSGFGPEGLAILLDRAWAEIGGAIDELLGSPFLCIEGDEAVVREYVNGFRFVIFGPESAKWSTHAYGEVRERDGNVCRYCGSTELLTIDHVRPRIQGGGDEADNLVVACRRCNQRKGGRTPEQAGMVLRPTAKA